MTTYVHTYIHTYVRTYLHSHIFMYVKYVRILKTPCHYTHFKHTTQMSSPVSFTSCQDMSDKSNPPPAWRQTRGRAATGCGQHCRHGAGWPGPAYGSPPAQHGTLDMPTGASKRKMTKRGSVLHSYMYVCMHCVGKIGNGTNL